MKCIHRHTSSKSNSSWQSEWWRSSGGAKALKFSRTTPTKVDDSDSENENENPNAHPLANLALICILIRNIHNGSKSNNEAHAWYAGKQEKVKGGRTRIISINMQIKKWAQQRTAYVIMQPERGKTETRIQIHIRIWIRIPARIQPT